MASRDVTYDVVGHELAGVPPQALDIEEAVIGICLNSQDALLDAMNIINNPLVFYKEAHQKIYACMVELFKSGSPVDILSLTEILQRKKFLAAVGGPLYITQLSGKAAGSFNAEYHCKIIIQKWIGREVIRISQESQKKAFNESTDVNDIIGEMISGITNTLNIVSTNTTKHASEITRGNVEVIEKIMAGEFSLQGVSTRIKELDDLCNGLQKSDLTIIAARTSMGKTSLMNTLLYNISVIGTQSAIVFSLEMSAEQLDMRLKIIGTEIESTKMFKGYINSIEMQRIRAISENIANAKLYIDDTPGITLMGMRTKLKRITMQEKIDVVFVDYLQLMRLDDRQGKNREQEVSEITNGLKNIAREFNIPVIALAQLSRQTEMSSDQRPKLSHLRESGNLEMAADQVWFIYRPFKVGIKEINGQNTYDQAEIIVAKHRNGPTGSAQIGFHEKIMKFMGREQLKDTQLEITHSDLYGGEIDSPF